MTENYPGFGEVFLSRQKYIIFVVELLQHITAEDPHLSREDTESEGDGRKGHRGQIRSDTVREGDVAERRHELQMDREDE